MADITSIMGGPWSPPKEFEPDPPELQLREAMAAAGITAPAELQLDGAHIHQAVFQRPMPVGVDLGAIRSDDGGLIRQLGQWESVGEGFVGGDGAA